MKSFSIFVTVLFLIISGATANLEEICKKATSSSTNVTYDFCFTNLQPIHGSNDVDIKGLAGIAINLAIYNLTGISQMLDDLQSKATNQTVIDALQACSNGVKNGKSQLLIAQTSVSNGRIQDALTSVRVAAGSSDVCDSAFNQRGIQSPVHDAMHGAVLLCNLAALIIQLLA